MTAAHAKSPKPDLRCTRDDHNAVKVEVAALSKSYGPQHVLFDVSLADATAAILRGDIAIVTVTSVVDEVATVVVEDMLGGFAYSKPSAVFNTDGLLFPVRVRTGAHKGELAWMPLQHWRVLRSRPPAAPPGGRNGAARS